MPGIAVSRVVRIRADNQRPLARLVGMVENRIVPLLAVDENHQSAPRTVVDGCKMHPAIEFNVLGMNSRGRSFRMKEPETPFSLRRQSQREPAGAGLITENHLWQE